MGYTSCRSRPADLQTHGPNHGQDHGRDSGGVNKGDQPPLLVDNIGPWLSLVQDDP